MNSTDYWANREAEQLKHYIRDEAEYDKQVKRIYTNMLDSVQGEINAFYGKYADKEGITLAEAKKRVSQLDIAAYERKAKRYVKDKDFSAKANEEMRLYNLTMKVNRLEMLKANIGLELITGHDELEKFMEGVLQGRTEEELKRQAGILGKTVRNNAQKAHAIVNGSFHNATFSDRIWQYQDLMRVELDRLLQTGLVQGKSPRAIAKDLRKYWFGPDPRTGGGAVYCMERLMRTELARVQTEAQKQSFQRNGFGHYMFICNEHASKEGTCDICRGLNGKHFPVVKMMPGENAPPMHPHCRCSTAAWEDSKEYEAWLDHLESGGTTATFKFNSEPDAAPLTPETYRDQLQQTNRSISDIKAKLKQVADRIDRHASKVFDDFAGLKKSDIAGKIKAIKKRQSEIDPLISRYYNRPERGTPEYDAWRAWKRGFNFDDLIAEQMKLAEDLVEGERKQRRWDDYEDWKKWKKENPLSALRKENDALADNLAELAASKQKLKEKFIKKYMYPEKIAGIMHGKAMSRDQANNGNTNPFIGTERGYSINCQTCVVAFEARLRGYNVAAKPNTKGSVLEKLSYRTNLAWIDPETGRNPAYIRDYERKSAKQYLAFVKEVVEQDKRYTIEFCWKGRGNGGHIVNIDRDENGQLRLKDNQRSLMEKSEWLGDAEVYEYLKRMKYGAYEVPALLRIDNMCFDPSIVDHIMEECDPVWEGDD